MSTLKTNNIEHVDASTPSVQMSIGGGVVFPGISTFTGNATFSGNVSIGGTLSYEDVTNIDSVGIITAQSGIHLDDSITHLGDTNTKIRFPAADTITAETGGSERLRITSAGNVNIGGNFTQSTARLFVQNGGECNLTISGNAASGGTGGLLVLKNRNGNINTGSAIQGEDASGQTTSAIQFINANDSSNEGYMSFFTRPGNGSLTERVRITDSGKVKIANHGTNDLRTLSVLGPQTQIQFGTAEDVGGFLLSTNNGQFGLAGGGYWNGSNWVAKHTASAQIRTDGSGVMVFCTNTSLTSGNTFVPSERFRIDSNGISGDIKNNYALVAYASDRDDASKSTTSTSFQDDDGLNITNAINYKHGDIFVVKALVPTGIALVSTDTPNYCGVFVRVKITPSSGSTFYTEDTKGWYRNDGRATKETMQMTTVLHHNTAGNTSDFSDNVNLSFQVQYRRESGGTGSIGATGLSIWGGERTLEIWQYRKTL